MRFVVRKSSPGPGRDVMEVLQKRRCQPQVVFRQPNNTEEGGRGVRLLAIGCSSVVDLGSEAVSMAVAEVFAVTPSRQRGFGGSSVVSCSKDIGLVLPCGREKMPVDVVGGFSCDAVPLFFRIAVAQHRPPLLPSPPLLCFYPLSQRAIRASSISSAFVASQSRM